MMRKIVSAALLLMTVWTLSGCHTLHGFGEDVGGAGRAIERSSD